MEKSDPKEPIVEVKSDQPKDDKYFAETEELRETFDLGQGLVRVAVLKNGVS